MLNNLLTFKLQIIIFKCFIADNSFELHKVLLESGALKFELIQQNVKHLPMRILQPPLGV